MASSSVNFTSLRIGDYVLRFRALIGGLLLLISAILGYYCTQVTVATKFDDFFPTYHPNVQLYHEWQKYGGAPNIARLIQDQKSAHLHHHTLPKAPYIPQE